MGVFLLPLQSLEAIQEVGVARVNSAAVAAMENLALLGAWQDLFLLDATRPINGLLLQMGKQSSAELRDHLRPQGEDSHSCGPVF